MSHARRTCTSRLSYTSCKARDTFTPTRYTVETPFAMQALFAVVVLSCWSFFSPLGCFTTLNLQFISGLKFGHCQSISQCGNVLHRCVCSLCRRSSGYSPTLPCWIYCTQCYYSSRSIFECKSFRFSVHGASLCSVACALSTCGLSLVIVFGSAYSARLPRSIPLFGGLCFVHLGA